MIGSRRALAAGLRLLHVGVGLLVLLCAASCGAQQAAPENAQPDPVETTVPRVGVVHEFVIPEGTGERMRWGQDVEIIPRPFEVQVGDKIRVDNEDVDLARLGIFDVRPGETVTMAFNTPGEMEGIIFSDQSGGCGVPPPDVETFVIDVRA